MVSVVVPTLDRRELLRRCLTAVLAQEFSGTLECIVVFDGTEPDVPEVPNPHGYEIRAITNNRKPGLAGGRNTGALAATGEFIAFCDDDDEWLPTKLSRQLAALESRPDAAAAATGIEIKYEDRLFRRVPPKDEVTFDDLLLSRRTDVHPSTFLFRRSLLEQIGFVDEDLPGSYAEDYEWLLRATRLGPVLTVRDPLVRIYWHRSSYFEGRWQTVATALTYLLERYPEFNRVPRGFARVAGQIAFAHSASGNRDEARRWARRTFSANWREPRTYLAVAVTLGLSPDRVLQLAHRSGKGI